MSANTLHIDLPPKHSPSVVPWIIVLACTAILLILCSQLLQSIPASLQAQAEQQLDTQEYPDVSVASNGRQLELSGNIDISQSPDKLVSSLANINGVREVVSKLVIVDPAVKAAEDAELFSRAIASVDVSSIRFQPGSVNLAQRSLSPATTRKPDGLTIDVSKSMKLISAKRYGHPYLRETALMDKAA